MIFVENNRSLELNIKSYQFPNERTINKEYNHDANWLVCEIKYSENDFTEVYSDACLLTCELEELADALLKILNGDDSGYISDLIEPYLNISIAKAGEKVLFIVHYVYDTSNGIWRKRKVTSLVDKEYATHILHELVELQKKYPQR